MSGSSTTLVYALPIDLAVSFRDAFHSGRGPEMGPDMGPDNDPIGLHSSSRNNFIETSLRPLIHSAGVSGLAHLERLDDFRADKPEDVDLPVADHGIVLAGAELQAAADGLRALQSALADDVDIVRRAMPWLSGLDDAMLARELDTSPDTRRRQLDEMSRTGRGADRPVRPHRYALFASDGALYETSMFLTAHLDVLEAAMAQGLAVVVVCWKY